LKRLLLVGTIFVFVYQARISGSAIGLLNAASRAAGQLPSDWQIKVNHGRPQISVCQDGDGGGPCLHLKSVKASFALERGVDVSPEEMPYLTWSWKVTSLPEGGDFRRASTDDQAAQVLVAFADRRIVTYLWDSTAPKGAMQSSSEIPLVHIFAVVCQSGTAEANRWVAENHNVAADYQRAYGKAAPHVKGLRLQINSQHTGTVAESYFGQVAFRSAPL
jgi:hypothetical protein